MSEDEYKTPRSPQLPFDFWGVNHGSAGTQSMNVWMFNKQAPLRSGSQYSF